MMSDEARFIDAEQYTGKGDDLSFRFLVLEHLRRIAKIASQEWHGGYTESRPIGGSGAVATFYIQASHAAYSNAVDALADLLHPYFDEEMKAADEKSEEEDDKLRESNDSTTKYYYRRVRIQRKLFRALCDFLHRQGYLEAGSYEEVDS